MPTANAVVSWRLEGDFPSGRYSRAHTIGFDGGVALQGSAAPAVVPPPWSLEAAADPEEMFTASLSACHMLWFLHLARDAGFVVRGYQDRPYGLLAPDEDGALAMTEVVLRPSLVFEGEAPSSAALQALHRAAHEVCFIARSVKTRVRIEEASESTARSGGDA